MIARVREAAGLETRKVLEAYAKAISLGTGRLMPRTVVSLCVLLYICVCVMLQVCVCACVRACVRACMCVCVCVCMKGYFLCL